MLTRIEDEEQAAALQIVAQVRKNFARCLDTQRFSDDRATMATIIEKLAAADAWNRAAQSLDKGYAAFAAYADRIPTENITFGLYIADMSAAPQAHGYTGFGAIPGWIMTAYDMPDEYNLERVEAATVHELHHNLAAAAKA